MNKWVGCVAFVALGGFLWSFARGDADVDIFCVFKQNCILPDKFKAADELIVHWVYLSSKDTPVHSYYRDRDQLAYQDQHFKGRTSLFKNELPGGNASLLLMQVDFPDQGRYKCYTSTTLGRQESFISLHVEAPVRKVDIQRVDDTITCRADRIFPEPKITWPTEPSSSLTDPAPHVQPTDDGLYNISSSATLSDADAGRVFICNVSAGRSWRRATLTRRPAISVSAANVTIHCAASGSPTLGLVWTFNRSQTILTRADTAGSSEVAPQWQRHVRGVSESGGLTLQDLSPGQEGTYSCEISDAEGTEVTDVFLRIARGGGDDQNSMILALVLGVPAAVVVAAVAAGLIWWCTRRKIREGKENGRQMSATYRRAASEQP